MKILYTQFVDGNEDFIQQRIVDTGDMDLLTYVASEAGLSYEDMMGTPEQPAPIDPRTWLESEFGLVINTPECRESYFILPS